MKEILSAKTSIWHLLVVFLTAIFLCTFLYMLGIPLVYWSAFGEGQESARIEEMPINIFIGNWGALILILVCCSIAFAYNFKKQDLKHAKSYFIIALLITALYLFRNLIIEFFI